MTILFIWTKIARLFGQSKTFSIKLCQQLVVLLFLLFPFLKMMLAIICSLCFVLLIYVAIYLYLMLNSTNCRINDLFLQFALPNNDDSPSFRLQRSPYFLVSLLIPCYFRHPEIGVGLGNSEIFAPLVSMPKTTVDEDDRAVFWKNNVGLPR